MPPVQDKDVGNEKGVKKLTWEEISKYYKRKWWLKATKKYQKKNPNKVKENTRKQNQKKNLKRQKEHPEEILAKRKFWVIKR
jgi:hypothetical protein